MYNAATPFGAPNLCPTIVSISTPIACTSIVIFPNDWQQERMEIRDKDGKEDGKGDENEIEMRVGINVMIKIQTR